MTTENQELSTYVAGRERRSRIKRIVALVLLLLLLALIGWSAAYYAANRRFAIPFLDTADQGVTPPEYLYSITGPEGPDALTQPIGLDVTEDDRVYVVDVKSAVVRVYDVEGQYAFSFSAIESAESTSLVQPARVMESPDGEIWVTDRRLRGIFIFGRDGTFLREFAPSGDLPDTWAPIAVAFDGEGRVYVSDVGITTEHQVIVLQPDGTEITRFGKTAQTQRIQDSPGDFYFPNGIAIANNGDIFVADGNNRRVQVFDSQGTFKQILATSGTPRGVVIDREQRLYVVDALAHVVDIYKLDGTRIVSFGGAGVGVGQFRFPSDVALDRRGRIFVSDRENHQVQVWGWPTGILPPITVPESPVQWGICLSPLLLLLIPLLRRRKTFVVTEDFVEGMALAEKLPLMNDRRFRWTVPQADVLKYAGRVIDGISLDDLLIGEPHSESDVNELVEKTGIDRGTAVLLTMASRAGRLATEGDDLRVPAESLGVDVVNRAQFLERFAAKRKK